MAGEGIPAFFWAQEAREDESVLQAGARILNNEVENFSYRNMQVAALDGVIAGMLLAYRLPDTDAVEDLERLPRFIRPLVELEQCVPGSFYINMLATFPQFRGRSVGTQLMNLVDALARKAGCDQSSIEVFEQNEGALRLYLRLGYRVKDRRPVIPHNCHPYDGEILLLTRPVCSQDQCHH